MFTTSSQAEFSARSAKATADTQTGESHWAVDEPRASTAVTADRDANTGQWTEARDNATAMPPAFLMPDTGEEADAPSALDIKRLLLGVWDRRLAVVFITAVITLGFLAIAIYLVDKTWTARSVVIKRVEVDQFQIGGGMPFKQQDYSFQTMLDTLMLKSTLLEALRQSGVEAKTTTLASAVSLVRGKQSNLFQVSVTWNNPTVAAALSNNLIGAFLENNRKMRRTEAKRAFDYYSNQLSDVETKAAELDRQMQDFQRAKKVINFDRQSEITLRKITDLDVQHRSIVAELEEIIANDAQLDARLAETPEMTIQTTLYKNPLKYKLSELEWNLEQLRGRYTDDNPKIIDLLDQVKSLKGVIAKGGDQATPENVYAINPVRASLIMKQLDNRDEISIKSALARSLGESLAQSRQELAELTENHRTYTGLLQERDSLSDLLDTLRNRVEEVRIIMESSQTDFDLIEAAQPPQDSNPTPKKLIAIAGCILGGGFAFVLALMLEFLDPRLKTAREVRGLSGSDRVLELQALPAALSAWGQIDHPDAELSIMMRRVLNSFDADFGTEKMKLVLISALDINHGSSEFAAKLATASCQKGASTLLVEADVTAKTGERYSDVCARSKHKTGLADFLLERAKMKDLRIKSKAELLSILRAGTQESLGREAALKLSGPKMRSMMNKFSLIQGRVIVDLPPVGKEEPVFELVTETRKIVLVLKSGETRKADLRNFMARAERSGIEVLGIVLTEVHPLLIEGEQQFSIEE